MSSIPPVVVPASGNNIVISSLQVHVYSCRKEISSLMSAFTARESGPGVHQKCGQRVWRHFSRLSSRKDDRCIVPEVLNPTHYSLSTVISHVAVLSIIDFIQSIFLLGLKNLERPITSGSS